MLRIQNDYSALGPGIGSSERSQFVVLTKRSAASGNENAYVCVEVKTRLEGFTQGRRNLELRTVSHFKRLKQPITWTL